MKLTTDDEEGFLPKLLKIIEQRGKWYWLFCSIAFIANLYFWLAINIGLYKNSGPSDVPVIFRVIHDAIALGAILFPTGVLLAIAQNVLNGKNILVERLVRVFSLYPVGAIVLYFVTVLTIVLT